MARSCAIGPRYGTTITSHHQMTFPRAQRLARASEIELVKRTGKRIKSGRMDVRVAASPSSRARVGVIVPKYGRLIVERNRLRRRLRELVRLRMLPALRERALERDVLIRALPSAYSASFDVLAKEVDGVVARIT